MPATDKVNQPPQLSYMPQLDGLRAIAVTAVIFGHALPDSTRFVPYHVLGVFLFFVLSGFLITSILLNARSRAALLGRDMRQIFYAFYVRRALRIFPPYYLLIAILTGIGVLSWTDGLVWHLAYLSNMKFAFQQSFDPYVVHFWSLAVEEQFYLLWPALILLLPCKWLQPAVVLAFALGTMSRAAIYIFTTNHISISMPVTSCLDCLAGGALLACLHFSGHRDLILRYRWRAIAACLPLAVAILIYRWTGGAGAHALFTVVTPFLWSVVFIYVIDAAAEGINGIAGKFLGSAALIYIGGISYGMYLYHFPIQNALKYFKMPNIALAFSNLIVTTVLATLSYYLFERPIVSLKHRFPYVRRS